MEVEVPLLGHWLEEVEEVGEERIQSAAVEEEEEEEEEEEVLLRLLDQLEEVSVQSFFAPIFIVGCREIIF